MSCSFPDANLDPFVKASRHNHIGILAFFYSVFLPVNIVKCNIRSATPMTNSARDRVKCYSYWRVCLRQNNGE